MKKLLIFGLLLILFPVTIYARVTPNDTYKAKVEQFQKTLAKIADPLKKDKVSEADERLYKINQQVTQRWLDEDIAKLSSILEELKIRKNVTETVVAFGQGDTPLDNAAYWVNYAAEAVAYQKIQDYTPQISETNFIGPITVSKNNLKGDLGVLRGKILKAKGEVQKAIDYVQK